MTPGVNRGTVNLGSFTFESGDTIPVKLAYETYGSYNGNNAVLVCHGLTGSQHVACDCDDPALGGQAAAWWSGVVGPGKAIDTENHFVVCANVPGSCYGSTGPTSTDPESGEPYRSGFPAVTVGDWVEAQKQLLDELGVDRLHAAVGGSVGGMNVLEWGKRYPGRVERLVPIACAARLDAQGLALDAVAKRAITTDPEWNDGDYDGEGPRRGLGLARQIGHVMYLSKDSMRERFGREPARLDDAVGFGLDGFPDCSPYREVESYLDHQARRFVTRFDANSYLRLLHAMDCYDLGEGCESDVEAVGGFDGEVLVVSIRGDWHFTVSQSRHLAGVFSEAGAEARHEVIESKYGHDSFLVETEKVSRVIRGFLALDKTHEGNPQVSG